MTIFKVVYDLTTPSNKVISYPTASDYAFGIKVTKAGVAQDGTITVKVGEETLTPEATQVDGFTIYNRTSSQTPGAVKVDVTYAKDGITQKFTLVEVIEDKSTFEKGSGSSGGGAWGSITGDLSDQTDLTAYIGEEVGDGVQTAKDYTDEKVAPCLTAESDPDFTSWKNSTTRVSIGGGEVTNGAIRILGSSMYGSASFQNGTTVLIGGKLVYNNDPETVCIGSGALATSKDVVIGYNAKDNNVANGNGVCIGRNAQIEGGTAIGCSAKSTNGTAIGDNSEASAARSVGIGTYAKATAQDAIQICNGTNSSAGTLQVWNFPLMNKSLGTLEAQRLGTGWSATGTLVLKSVNGNVQWVSE